MMKRLLLYIFAAALCLAACKPAPSLSFDKNVSAKAEGGSMSLNVSCNYEWTAKSDVTWITVRSCADGKLNINVDKNRSYDSRTGKIGISCEGLSDVMTVTQEQMNIVKLKNGSEVSISYEEQDVNVALEGNVSYTYSITDGSDWLKAISVKGLSDSSISLHASENPSTASRSATIKIDNAEKAYSASINVVQAGSPQLVTITHNNKTFAAPTLFGFNMKAEINWGDGNTQTYKSNISHTYNTASEHVVVLKGESLSTVSLSDIVGVSSIDFSKF